MLQSCDNSVVNKAGQVAKDRGCSVKVKWNLAFMAHLPFKPGRMSNKARIPIPRPLAPMDAKLVEEIPKGNGWQYEPKWDGFRCLVFRDARQVELQSKAGQPLTRYFPELVAAFAELRTGPFVLDGEI